MPRRSIAIDRMTMEVPGISAEEGRRVALLVAAGLGAAGALPAAGDMTAVRIELTADRNAGTAALARHIIAAILQQLRRSP